MFGKSSGDTPDFLLCFLCLFFVLIYFIKNKYGQKHCENFQIIILWATFHSKGRRSCVPKHGNIKTNSLPVLNWSRIFFVVVLLFPVLLIQSTLWNLQRIILRFCKLCITALLAFFTFSYSCMIEYCFGVIFSKWRFWWIYMFLGPLKNFKPFFLRYPFSKFPIICLYILIPLLWAQNYLLYCKYYLQSLLFLLFFFFLSPSPHRVCSVMHKVYSNSYYIMSC